MGFEVNGKGSNRPCMKMKTRRKNALKSKLNGSKTITVSIGPVDDGYQQQGPFKKYATVNTLLSPIISITPNADVDVAAGDVEICMSINDETANTDAQKCTDVLS